jgi:VIT1/CCC1 family predicted Fe2+/Mn2+ transporter
MMNISNELRDQLKVFQKNEITEHHIYTRLARSTKISENKRILEEIAGDELDHYKRWREYTQQDVRPNKLKLWLYYFISRIFGITFGIKLMEMGEEDAQDHYEKLHAFIPDIDAIIQDENEHESKLINLIDEERLRYMGSIVLGLNDALVELTGALAGLTLALQNTRLIALTGLITGVAAALSMGASEYLSTKSEETIKNPFRASIYTGSAYIVTVFVLILPYLIAENFYVALGFTMAFAILIIAFFNYYISVAKDVEFKERFLEMTILSLGVAAVSFVIGSVFRSFLGIDA